nr:MAG TPA: hypothetical protein [Caudoviricetes sp.]
MRITVKVKNHETTFFNVSAVSFADHNEDEMDEIYEVPVYGASELFIESQSGQEYKVNFLNDDEAREKYSLLKEAIDEDRRAFYLEALSMDYMGDE